MKEIKSNKKNILRKVFVKLCRLLGFEIIDQSNFTIPTMGQSINSHISVPGKSSVTLPLGEIKITRTVKSLDVILRTCMTVNMLTQSKKRMFEKDKEEYTIKTLNSVLKSINQAKKIFINIKFRVFVIDHNSKKNQIENMRKILKNSGINFEILNLEFKGILNI